MLRLESVYSLGATSAMRCLVHFFLFFLIVVLFEKVQVALVSNIVITILFCSDHKGAIPCSSFMLAIISMSSGKLDEKYRGVQKD